jgi:hypothetical protein
LGGAGLCPLTLEFKISSELPGLASVMRKRAAGATAGPGTHLEGDGTQASPGETCSLGEALKCLRVSVSPRVKCIHSTSLMELLKDNTCEGWVGPCFPPWALALTALPSEWLFPSLC